MYLIDNVQKDVTELNTAITYSIIMLDLAVRIE